MDEGDNEVVIEVEVGKKRKKPCSEPSSSGSTTSTPVLEGWTKVEKFNLLQALKAYGSANIDDINKYISEKTREEIVIAIEFYRAKGNKSCLPKKSRRKKQMKLRNLNKMNVPLGNWAKMLTDSIDIDELQTETSTALRLIAEFEDMNMPICTGNINFRELYFLLADVMDGRSPPIDKSVMAVLEKCLFDCAMYSKSFIKSGTLNYILSTAEPALQSDMQKYVIPTTDTTVALLRHFATKRQYNPFNINEDLLKPVN